MLNRMEIARIEMWKCIRMENTGHSTWDWDKRLKKKKESLEPWPAHSVGRSIVPYTGRLGAQSPFTAHSEGSWSVSLSLCACVSLSLS